MSGWSATSIGDGLPPFTAFNRTPNRFGNSSDALSLTSLLAELVTISQNFQVGGSGERRTKEQLTDSNATASVYIPTLLNHDVTLGHHINGRAGEADPAPTIELYYNGVLAVDGGPAAGMRYGLATGSCDTVGFIGFDNPQQQTPIGDVVLRVIYGDPYWNATQNPTNPRSVPVVYIQPRGETGLPAPQPALGPNAAFTWNGSFPGYVVSERTHFDLTLRAAALRQAQNIWLSYTVIGSRIAEIP